MARSKRIELGKHIVADPEICHGQPTFKGTRIMVKSVLDLVAKGWEWERISKEYYRKVEPEAISEAIELAGHALASKTTQRQRTA